MIEKFNQDYTKMRDQLGKEVTYRPQHGLYTAATESYRLKLTERVMDLADHKTMVFGRKAHYAAEDSYVAQGDVDALRALWDDSVEADFFSPDTLRHGGDRDRAVRAAAFNQVETAAQQIYEAEGIDATREWVQNPTNHPAEWGLEDQGPARGHVQHRVPGSRAHVHGRGSQGRAACRPVGVEPAVPHRRLTHPVAGRA